MEKNPRAVCAGKSRAPKRKVDSLHSQISNEADERDQAPEGQRLDHVKIRSNLPDFGHWPIPSFEEAVKNRRQPASGWLPRMNLFFVWQNPGTIRTRDARRKSSSRKERRHELERSCIL
jgi:hypothetical protein